VPAHLNIALVARRTGVPAATLRKWEQRYGVLRPTRSAGGHRRYSDVDVDRVEWLKARLAEGYRIAEASALLGGETAGASTRANDLRDSLYRAVSASDIGAMRSLLDQAFALRDVESTLTQVIAPLLVRTGEGWADGDLTVAQEHVLSAEVRARLEPLLTATVHGVRGSIVLACAPGERHELGPLMLGVLLRRDGWRVIFLGADTPLAGAAAMVAEAGASALCLSASMQPRAERLARELKNLKLARTEVVVGGRAIDEATARKIEARYLDADLAHAVRSLREFGA
jgi:MerR family transcriptional regulator, light-induced transcriptional regulator